MSSVSNSAVDITFIRACCSKCDGTCCKDNPRQLLHWVTEDYEDAIERVTFALNFDERVGTMICHQLHIKVLQDSPSAAADWKRIIRQWVIGSKARQQDLIERQLSVLESRLKNQSNRAEQLRAVSRSCLWCRLHQQLGRRRLAGLLSPA